MGLMVLPSVTAKHRASSSRRGAMLCSRASRSTSGVPMIARVSFISSAEPIPPPNRISSTRASLLRARPNRP